MSSQNGPSTKYSMIYTPGKGLSLPPTSQVGSGSVVVFGSSFPPKPSVGALCYRTDQGILYGWNGTAWGPLSTTLTYNGAGTIAARSIVQDTLRAGTGASTKITFAQGQFRVSYTLQVFDETALSAATITAKTLTSFTFTSTFRHYYSYAAIGS